MELAIVQLRSNRVESQAICHNVSQYLSVELAKLAFSKGFAFSIFFGDV